MYEFDPERLAKLAELRAEGMNPYPTGLVVKRTATEVLALIGDRAQEALRPTRRGRASRAASCSRTRWARPGSRASRIARRIQVYVQKNAVGDAAFAAWKRSTSAITCTSRAPHAHEDRRADGRGEDVRARREVLRRCPTSGTG